MSIKIYTPFTCLFLVWIGLSSCDISPVKFQAPVSINIDSANVLRAKVNCQLDNPSEAFVKFWIVGKEDSSYFSQLSAPKQHHQIPLVGLKGATTYQYQVIARKDGEVVESNIDEFTTQKFPINVLHLRWQDGLKAGLSGFILSQRRLVNGIIYMIDKDGDVVWYQHVPKQAKLSHWTANHSVLVLYGAAKHRNSAGDHIVEYDLHGNELLHLDLSSLPSPMEAHHEVRYDRNGDLVTLIYEHKDFDLSAIGGDSIHNVMGDQIIRMDRKGNVRWRWSIFDYLDPQTDPTILKTAGDWSHGNCLSIDRDGNYLVSFRNFNQIWKINSKNGEVIWKLGEGGTLALDKESYFYGQHAFHLNEEGDYMVFDNGRKHRQTRVLTFNLDASTKQAKVKLDIDLPEKFYSDRMGNAYLMNNKNILICAPRTNSLVVIDREGEVLAHAKVGIPDPYRAEFVPQLYPLDHVK